MRVAGTALPATVLVLTNMDAFGGVVVLSLLILLLILVSCFIMRTVETVGHHFDECHQQHDPGNIKLLMVGFGSMNKE